MKMKGALCMKRTLCVLLSMVLALTGLVGLGMTTVFATGGTDGSITWDYNESAKTLTFSGGGAIPDYEKPDNRPWRSVLNSGCESIVVENGVTGIGANAAYGCGTLRNVTIADSVTSIGFCAFQNCSNLATVSMGKKLANIGSAAFSQCYKLTAVTGENSVVTIGSNAFYSCQKLETFTLSDCLQSIGSYAFENCYVLEDMTIPASVKTIGKKAFFKNQKMKSVSIPAGVTSIGELTFFGCSTVQTVSLPNSVTRIDEYAFAECHALTDVSFSGTAQQWNTVSKGECIFGWQNKDGTFYDRATSEMPTFHFLTSGVQLTLSATVSKKLITNTGGTVSGAGTFEKGTQATIIAVPDKGMVFDGWYSVHPSDGLIKLKYSNAIQSITLNANETLAALFVKAVSTDCTVTLTATEGGSVSGGGIFHPGQTAQISAKENSGWHFCGWFDGETKLSGSANYAFDVTKNVSLTAKFEKNASENPTQDSTLSVPSSATVSYRSKVTITVTADKVPSGFFVALYEGETQIAKGDNNAVSHNAGQMKTGKTYTARIVDANGSVQSNTEGKLEKTFTITVKTGFFDKVKAFFQSLFGLLPKVELKP